MAASSHFTLPFLVLQHLLLLSLFSATNVCLLSSSTSPLTSPCLLASLLYCFSMSPCRSTSFTWETSRRTNRRQLRSCIMQRCPPCLEGPTLLLALFVPTETTRVIRTKIIGARWYIKGYEAEFGKLNTSDILEFLSARDAVGHGTHTSSTAAGAFVGNASFMGIARGIARGGALRARLAIYKVCWATGGCSSADILAAFDDAIHDGVDVLSVSLGQSPPLPTYIEDVLAIGSFHAVARGITVVCSAGNSGPFSQTVINTAPWVVLCFQTRDQRSPLVASDTVRRAHGVAVIFAQFLTKDITFAFDFACVQFSTTKTVLGTVIAPEVAYFSSRGPSSLSPFVLKYSLGIVAEGAPHKQANPFDFGGGHVDPNKAIDPGLVYDMRVSAYVHFLCSMGYNNSAVSALTQHPTICHDKDQSQKDLNLPSITIPELKESFTVTRTVTNVGPVASTYTAHVEAPRAVSIRVRPSILAFNSTVKKLKFKVTFESRLKVQSGYLFGSLTWKDGVHHLVRIPLAIRIVIDEFNIYT
ncbi:hypothetical protein B296_00027272 [Ensete ventricosum]|uniref:Subtilisin-like protease fibronectin type-III domain-containing protein n=1 Tax=Ensete ventricosum TaxID=4639 RepID=A0A427A2B4_ENSVE|nr:hypothetical protein B296_00027272 [Ensete ventricosum]